MANVSSYSYAHVLVGNMNKVVHAPPQNVMCCTCYSFLSCCIFLFGNPFFVFFLWLRKRMQINESESFYLLVNCKALMSTSLTILEVYKSQRDEDGFLYMMYASQEMFG